MTPAMKHAALALVATIALAGPAQAQRQSAITGTKLVEFCSSKDKTALTSCDAYIDGVADAVSVYQNLRPRDGSKGQALPANAYICVPAGGAGTQLREQWLAWAKRHPDDMGRQATGLVLRALLEAHPCPGAPAGAASGGAPKQ